MTLPTLAVDPASAAVRATTADGATHQLAALWLRERASDPASLDPATRQRLFDPHQLPEDLRLVEARVASDGVFWLAFSDGYAGPYHTADLAREVAADLDVFNGCPAPRPWMAVDLADPPRVPYSHLAAESGLKAALEPFLTLGFVVITGTATTPGTILDVVRQFGHVLETNFGMLFEVRAEPGSNDLAYRDVALGPHTDNPYREPVPGIQALHCLRNEAEGGLSTLVDSLAACERLRAEDPEGHDALARIPVRFRFTDGTTELAERRTIIQHDAAGRIVGLNYSPRLDHLPLLDTATLAVVHRARKRLAGLLADPEAVLTFLLQPGELMMFDNRRVLHGRTAFDSNTGHRHLQGCYIGADGPRSLWRVLHRASAA